MSPLALLVLLFVTLTSTAFSSPAPFSLSYSSTTPSHSFIRTTHHSVGAEPWQTYNQSEFAYHLQLVDHFRLNNRSRWTQRFWTVDQFATDPATAPVLYLLCGEYTCPGVRSNRLFPLQLAYEFKALVVIAEHRYYGGSLPTSLETVNLPLLNSRQALEDFAVFQVYFQEIFIDVPYKGAGTNRWLVIGGSYPGALSAWYRLKYPHLVVGSLASSAVVEAVLDFPAFDAQVERSAGPVCAAALRDITGLVEAALPGVMDRFHCPAAMNEDDFLFMVADSGVEGIQYGMREKLCNAIVPPYLASLHPPAHSHRGAAAPAADLLGAFVNYTLAVFFGEQGNACGDYSRRTWEDLTPGNADRSWGWQTCTEVGYWQVARPPGQSIRSQRINRAYYQALCKEVFGVTELPAVEETNIYFGGWNLSTSATFFVNGVEDPWQWASVRHPLGPTVPAVVVNCSQCAHCVDLVTPTDDDAATLKDVRARITQFVRRLLA